MFNSEIYVAFRILQNTLVFGFFCVKHVFMSKIKCILCKWIIFYFFIIDVYSEFTNKICYIKQKSINENY